MGRRKKRKPIKLKLEPETVNSVSAAFLFLLGVLIMVSFTGQGQVLAAVNGFLQKELGISMLFLPFVFFSSGLMLLRAEWSWSKPNVLLGTLIMMAAALIGGKTGDVGQETFANLAQLLGPLATYITALFLGLVGLLISMQSSLKELVEWVVKLRQFLAESVTIFKVRKLRKKQIAAHQKKGFSLSKLKIGKNKDKSFSGEQEETESEGEPIKTGTAVASSQKQQEADLESSEAADLEDQETLTPDNMPVVWDYPPLSLLSSDPGGEADRGDVNQNAHLIEETLDSFGVDAEVVEVNYGPSVTQYGLQVARGTRLSKITSLSTDLAMALAAPTGQIRIEAPIAGRSLVGIEVPNYSPQYVTLKTVLNSSKLKNHPSKLAVGLGLDVSGKPVIADIKTMPHLLIAGATGSGKSVCINSFLSSLLFRTSPSELRLILVDPKRVELTGYNDIPHLLTPVIVDPPKVVSALKWAVKLMEKRYKKLDKLGVRNIDSYNELAGLTNMPSLVIVVDEMADIMLYAPGEVEETITRIAQMARAVGIHLVLSTQRPSVDVITGLIKANIPARIAFNVSSNTDSRVILDEPGAEKLLGKGDMLFLPPEKSKPTRIQGTYVSAQETKNLIDYLKSQGEQPQYEEDITTKYKSKQVEGLEAAEEQDELFDDAVKVFKNRGKASASLLQRRLSIGYNRAARILDQLHQSGLIGPHQGSKARDVNMPEIKTYLDKTEGE